MNKTQVTPMYIPRDKPMSVAVLLSGSGTNFIAIHQEQKRLEKSGVTNYGRIDVVFTNVPNCKGARIAQEYDIPLASLSSKKYFELLDKIPDHEDAREFYDAAVILSIEEVCNPDLIVLAGYRRRLSSLFLKKYQNRIINLYPGDITKEYLVKGVEACVQAIRVQEKDIKCSVYLEKENERFGPAIIQSESISLDGYTEADKEVVGEQIREKGEWKIFPYAVHQLIATGSLELDEEGCLYLEGVKLDHTGLQFGK